MQLEQLARVVNALVEEAGSLAAKNFRPGQKTLAEIHYKDGGSPVTTSDMAVDALLRDKLLSLLPEAGWLSEETADNPDRLTKDWVWVVDPIDGTRAFVSGHPDWCVSVALLCNGIPVLGNIFAPALNVHYQAVKDKGALRDNQIIRVSEQSSLDGCRIAGPKPMMLRLQQQAQSIYKLDRIPSLALRIARVAEGSIDICLVSTMARDWDIAAADLILQEAGGIMTGIDHTIISYNNPYPAHAELAACSKLLHSSLIDSFATRPLS